MGIKKYSLVFGMGLLAFLLIGCASAASPDVEVAEPAATQAQIIEKGSGIQPLPTDSTGFYYYVNTERVQLTLSLKWIAVKFSSEDAAKQSSALDNSITTPLDQAYQIPPLKLTIIPLQEGQTIQSLVSGINSLRENTEAFLQVNPVFETADAEMTLTDEFIATFPPGATMDEINAINSSYGVEIAAPILGQENTFVLRATAKALRDTLSLANLYQESGAALYSSPNFVRIK